MKKFNKDMVLEQVYTWAYPTVSTGEYITLLNLIYLEAMGRAFKYPASHCPWAR